MQTTFEAISYSRDFDHPCDVTEAMLDTYLYQFFDHSQVSQQTIFNLLRILLELTYNLPLANTPQLLTNDFVRPCNDSLVKLANCKLVFIMLPPYTMAMLSAINAVKAILARLEEPIASSPQNTFLISMIILALQKITAIYDEKHQSLQEKYPLIAELLTSILPNPNEKAHKLIIKLKFTLDQALPPIYQPEPMPSPIPSPKPLEELLEPEPLVEPEPVAQIIPTPKPQTYLQNLWTKLLQLLTVIKQALINFAILLLDEPQIPKVTELKPLPRLPEAPGVGPNMTGKPRVWGQPEKTNVPSP